MLENEANLFAIFKERLLEIEPEIDELTLNDTLEGLTNLHEAIENVIRSALFDEAMAAGLRVRQDELKSRLARLANRAGRKREIVRDVMADNEIKKIEAPDFTLFIRNASPATIVTDEHRIPEKYWETQAPKLNKRAILEDLKNGETIAGAELSNPSMSLSVRKN